MNTTAAPVEARWKSYLKAVLFLLPALFLWQISCIWFFPKLQMIWRDAGAGGSDLQWVMHFVGFLVRNGSLILIVAAVGLLLMEWFARSWPRARRFALGLAVFALNTAVLLGLASMCLAAVSAAPALAHAR